jgi:hypothetical protein
MMRGNLAGKYARTIPTRNGIGSGIPGASWTAFARPSSFCSGKDEHILDALQACHYARLNCDYWHSMPPLSMGAGLGFLSRVAAFSRNEERTCRCEEFHTTFALACFLGLLVRQIACWTSSSKQSDPRPATVRGFCFEPGALHKQALVTNSVVLAGLASVARRAKAGPGHPAWRGTAPLNGITGSGV